jgi:nucleoside-diphosphate-sugar epimerase
VSKNILVTGGGGYIGSILVPELLAAGHKVTVLDNFMFKQNSLAACCAHPNFSVVRGDFRVGATLKPLIAKADVIIPLAALVGAPLCAADPIGARATNKEGAIDLINSVSPDQWILMPTTNSAYGSGDKGNFCTEDSPLRPISSYAIDKVEVEKRLMDHPNSISFRLATVFGMSPRMRLDLLVNDFVYRAVNDKFIILFESHFKRNYIHVRDVSGVFMHGLSNLRRLKGQIFNVGLSEANISKFELCEAIAEQVPGFVFQEASMGSDPDQRNYIVSNAKIEATGFKPSHSLQMGIRELIKGYSMIRNTVYSNV